MWINSLSSSCLTLHGLIFCFQYREPFLLSSLSSALQALQVSSFCYSSVLIVSNFKVTGIIGNRYNPHLSEPFSFPRSSAPDPFQSVMTTAASRCISVSPFLAGPYRQNLSEEATLGESSEPFCHFIHLPDF